MALLPEPSRFQLSEFQSQVLGRGLARPSRFEVVIPKPLRVTGLPQVSLFQFVVGLFVNGIEDISNLLRTQSDRVSLLCEQASIPMLNLNTKPYRIYGPPHQRPVVSDFGGDGIPLTFHVDRQMQVKNFFDAWIQTTVNKDTFNVAFQEDYAVEVEIFQLDEQNNRTYGIKLVEAFPRSLNLMELNHNAQNQTHRLIVLFAYRRWERIT